MADIEHSSLPDSQLHEPKGIASAVANTVLIADGAGSGSWSSYSWNNLSGRQETFAVKITNISTAGSTWIVCPFTGLVKSLYSVIEGPITSGDCTITPRIAGVAMTDGAITISFSGSAAGDIDSSNPSGNNSITAGQAIELESSGGSAGAVSAVISIVVEI